MRTETGALGRALPTVALFPAGAENFASIGAARERETSTPGYRPGLRRPGGQQGGLVPSTSPPVSTLHHSRAAHRPSPRTHCPACAVHSTTPAVPQPHPAQQDSRILSLELLASLSAAGSCALQRIPARAPAEPSWGCWGTRTGVHVHAASPGMYECIPCPSSASAQPRWIKPKFPG